MSFSVKGTFMGISMPDDKKLQDPWLVAVWPGMGHVALAAGYYLLAKLEMSMLAEFSSRELFDIENVEVKDGLIVPGQMPRSRLFVRKDRPKPWMNTWGVC
ncbi:MAG: PAC2 family protein [Planctomycetaceae bacterium]